MAKIGYGNFAAAAADAAARSKDQSGGQHSTEPKCSLGLKTRFVGVHNIGHKLACFTYILALVLIQFVDCRHHDLNNVIILAVTPAEAAPSQLVTNWPHNFRTVALPLRNNCCYDCTYFHNALQH